VEDDDQLRRATKRVLEDAGYQVLTAADGQEALEVLRQQGEGIRLVLSDLVMPRLGGRALYDAARLVGEQVRRVAELDRAALERDGYSFNVHLLLGGQLRGQRPGLCLVYPQGNLLSATEDSPYLQIGESKYGRPILDRGIRYDRTTLEEAAKYALISLDSTMRSNVTVGPPIDLLVYGREELRVTRHRRLDADDADLKGIRAQWEQALRKAGFELPAIPFR